MNRSYIIILFLCCFVLLTGCSQNIVPDITEPTVLEITESTVPDVTDPTIPGVNLEPSRGFTWDVREGIAYLTGIGSVSEGDIVIPAQVRLTAKDTGWIEDESAEQVYPVTVASDAFTRCASLNTVTFNTGVSIENNSMHGAKYGMFSMCTNLTMVYNIPDSVVSMQGAFINCYSLNSISNFPQSLENLSGCFSGCRSLEQIPNFPAQLKTMEKCFVNCVALAEVPDIPQTVTDMRNCFQGCSALRKAPPLPEGITDLTMCFQSCSSLIHIEKLPNDAVILDNCFEDCSALISVPILPNSVQSMDSCFRGCTALAVAPDLPDSVQNMNSCFMGCTALVVAPELPYSVQTMDSCFMDCSSLTHVGTLPASLISMSQCFAECVALPTVPEIPDSVADIRYAFVNCYAMKGYLTVPLSAVKGTSDFHYVQMLNSTQLEGIYLSICTYWAYKNRTWPVEVIQALYDHVSEGICPYCGEENAVFSSAVGSPEVVLDRIPEYYANWFTDFIENNVPDFLKEECSKITYTPYLTEYSDHERAPYRNGFARGGEAYIKLRESTSDTAYTIIHELAHCFDHFYQYSSTLDRVNDRYSGVCSVSRQIGEYSHSEEWLMLHEAEGNTAAQWYGAIYWSYSKIEQQQETFAIAVGKYFTAPNTLKAYCPGMYAYVDTLFGDLLADQSEEDTAT